MDRRRLEILVGMLENHEKIFPDLKFDMDRWHCGYAACALGSAACYPPFMEEGLILSGGGGEEVPQFMGEERWVFGEKAAALFFDIPEKDASMFFYNSSYDCSDGKDITPQMVADKVRKYLDA